MTTAARIHALILLAFLSLGLWRVTDARAQPAAVTAVTTAPARAEAGEAFVVELRVSSDEGPMRAEDPSLTPPIGVAATQPSVSFFTNTTTVNGVRRSQSEYRARWTLRAREPGRYAIEAPSVGIRGRRVRGNPVSIEIVPAGQGSGSSAPSTPAPGVQFQFSWPFGQSGGGMDDAPDDAPSSDLALPSAPPGKETIFLRAVTDKTTAYVGEQVTLSFYLYFRVSDVEWTDRTEAPLADFLRMPILKDPGTGAQQRAAVGGRSWSVKLLDRVAIFPLRSGTLNTGSMAARFRGRRIGSRVLETSNDVTIESIVPPEAGRPPGYAVGDVGRFEIDADVKPRDVTAGGSFTVTVRVKGDGNPPASLKMPSQPGIDYLDPDKSVEHVIRGGRLGGQRTFKYLAKATRGGFVELGSVEVPYWNAEKKAYEVAKADLGGIRVAGDAPPPAASASAAVEADALAALPAPRGALRPWTRPESTAVPLLPLLGVLLAPPLIVVFALGSLRAARATRRRLDERRAAPTTRVREALDEARAADVAADKTAVAAAVERAVHAAIEAASGVRSRGLMVRDLPDALEAKGLDRAVAQRAATLLGDAEALRFDPLADAANRTALVDRARAVARELAAAAPPSS